MTASSMKSNSLNFDKWKNSAGLINGTVLNHAYYEFNPGYDYYQSFTTDYNSPIAITYIPLYATSMLYVRGHIHGRSVGTGRNGMASSIKRDSTIISASGSFVPLSFYYKTDEVNHHITLENNILVPANTTTPTTFRVWCSVGWGAWEHSAGFGTNRIEVWEIQQ